VNPVVIDASVAIKWVVDEADSDAAVAVLESRSLLSPDLLIAECANILWKKVWRRELTTDEAIMAARTLQQADIDILPTRHLLDGATRLAIDLNHAAYDCVYLALAMEHGCPLVTADARLRRKLAQFAGDGFSGEVLSMQQARITG
jgi:predicted nucleic acid-binding protein